MAGRKKNGAKQVRVKLALVVGGCIRSESQNIVGGLPHPRGGGFGSNFEKNSREKYSTEQDRL